MKWWELHATRWKLHVAPWLRDKWWEAHAVRRRAIGVLTVGGVSLLVAVSVLVGWPDWAALGRWTRPHAAPLALLGVTVVCVAVGLRLLLRGDRAPASRVPAMSWWVVPGAAVVVTLVAWGATSWLLVEASTAKDVGAARVDAIKTGLGIGAGATGIFALLLAVRRQWHSEADATEKNVTELYTKAADQLGSNKAPVRLAGLYALERLAQGNPLQRQSIVNVLCAYLRMPYNPPGTEPLASEAAPREAELAEHLERTQEREVRLAAQHILIDHLKPRISEAFWDGIDLDLTGAHLIDFDMSQGQVRNVRFVGATFDGDANFSLATFDGDYALFIGASFSGEADFGGATFADRFLPAGFVSIPVTIADFRNATQRGKAFVPSELRVGYWR